MKLFAIVFLVVLAAASQADNEWEQFKAKHKRTFRSPEHESHRRKIFMENLRTIRKHNFEADLDIHSWYMGVNQFGDMTDDEIADSMTGLGEIPQRVLQGNSSDVDFGNFKAPREVDWRKKGLVNEVANQKQCGSCYAFGAIASIEGQYKKLTGKLVKFSEQMIVDCTYMKVYDKNTHIKGSLKNQGCNGGSLTSTFGYSKSVNGLMLDKDYPYKAKRSQCKFNRRNKGKLQRFHVKSIKSLYHSSGERKVRDAVAKIGPVAACINARAPGFMRYYRGVFSVRNCRRRLSHAVAIVGYGVEKGKRGRKGKAYWLVRNSWSKYWGDHGYFKVARNKRDMCGICSWVEYALLRK